MAKACDLERNSVVAINNQPHIVEDLSVSTPSARGAATLYRLRFRNIVTKAKVDMTCKGDEAFGDVAVERRPAQYLFNEQDQMVFMDSEDFSQFGFTRGEISAQADFLTPDQEVRAIFCDGRALAIELPASVVLKVVETAPVVRGASVTARAKPAKLETGLMVQVPEYLTEGERVNVDTRTGRFLSRA
ncbi:MAG: elongation factor P [Kiritimatiellaeota bacterium]|nr:elongation factor P [Kiritimatiellota bacterium]